MSGCMTSLATSFSIKMIIEAMGKQKIKYNEEKKIRDIQVLISDFNRKFDNTVVDTYTFQKFIETEKFQMISLREFLKEKIQVLQVLKI
ncbi:hypothetical protein [Bacillus sp. 'calajunan']|uniref:hypothetical protein n=1 Tax=Bacillus sp. 'calajunan' TaxID=3447457 RepID=UPI003EDF0863